MDGTKDNLGEGKIGRVGNDQYGDKEGGAPSDGGGATASSTGGMGTGGEGGQNS